MVRSFYDFFQSHKVSLEFISLLAMNLEFLLMVAMPFSNVRIHLSLPILMG
jgi:hypothetical protein